MRMMMPTMQVKETWLLFHLNRPRSTWSCLRRCVDCNHHHVTRHDCRVYLCLIASPPSRWKQEPDSDWQCPSLRTLCALQLTAHHSLTVAGQASACEKPQEEKE